MQPLLPFSDRFASVISNLSCRCFSTGHDCSGAWLKPAVADYDIGITIAGQLILCIQYCAMPSGVRQLSGQLSTVQRRHRAPGVALRALEKTDEGELAEALPSADGLDAEILRLLIPATLAVFLDPAMALIDTGVICFQSLGQF